MLPYSARSGCLAVEHHSEANTATRKENSSIRGESNSLATAVAVCLKL